MKAQKATIIVPVRTEFEMAKLCLTKAMENATIKTHKYIFLFDNPEEEKYLDFITFAGSDIMCEKYKSDSGRIGLMQLVENGIGLVKTDYFFYIHADMVPGPGWDEKMFAAMPEQGNATICGTRIEPSIFGADKAKHQVECGTSPADFDYDKFLAACKIFNSDKTLEGFFAPHLFKKSEWIGYDMRFAPQSREETDLGLMLKDAGIQLINARGALFYHFAGRGSRRKDSTSTDSEEWKKSNYKNERNFLRKWRQPIFVNEYCAPIRKTYNKTTALGLIVSEKDSFLVAEYLRYYEPYFDKVYIAIDKTGQAGSYDEALTVEQATNTYIKNEKTTCEIFDETKILISYFDKKDDFASLRNHIVDMNECDTLLMLDADEIVDIRFLSNVREFTEQIYRTDNILVYGFPRANFIDGKQTPVWPDYQFRFVKKGVKWTNTSPAIGAIPGCHEFPEPVLNKEKQQAGILSAFVIQHAKTSQRQKEQNKYYEEIENGKHE